jgi:osmotically-inducible protein OsmY
MNLNSKLKPLAFVLITLFLTGCIAAVVTGAAVGMVYDRRSMSTIESDIRLFHVVHTGIVTHPLYGDSRILVTSFNRVILLVGQTPSASFRVLAEKIAQKAAGVQRIYNEITVGYPISMADRAQDSWITSQVRSSMLARKGLESGSIRIVTENGIVYLMGIVTQQQAALAVDVARRVNEVRKVVKIFRYIH